MLIGTFPWARSLVAERGGGLEGCEDGVNVAGAGVVVGGADVVANSSEVDVEEL